MLVSQHLYNVVFTAPVYLMFAVTKTQEQIVGCLWSLATAPME